MQILQGRLVPKFQIKQMLFTIQFKINMPEERRVTRKREIRNMAESDEESSSYALKKHEKYKRWNEKQHAAYIGFLERHISEFQSQRGKKRKNLFMRMAEEIDCDRNNEQCRTHHEKKMKKYGGVQQIIAEYRKTHKPTQPMVRSPEEVKVSPGSRYLKKKTYSFGNNDEKVCSREVRTVQLPEFLEVQAENLEDERPPPLMLSNDVSNGGIMEFNTPDIHGSGTPASERLFRSLRSPRFNFF